MKKGLGECAFAVLMMMGIDAHAQPGPVLDTDFPDPFVLDVEHGLVAYATNTVRNGRPINVQVSRSLDGMTWTPPVEAMSKLPSWVRRRDPDIWAPEVMRIGANYVLFFSARHATLKRPDGLTLCVGSAVAASPAGPFVPQSKPLTCGGRTGVIDASPFRDGDRLWLYVKTDGNCCGAPISILALPLSADGLRLTGKPYVVAGLTNDQPWEERVIEAPQMITHHGRYFMFFSANDYGGERYAAGYALCETATGPCRDAPENPVLATTSVAVSGPGHQSVYTFKGKRFIAFHGWRQTDRRRYRAMYRLPLWWRDNRAEIGRPEDGAF